jgi:hypothetical protein
MKEQWNGFRLTINIRFSTQLTFLMKGLSKYFTGLLSTNWFRYIKFH